MCRALSIRSRLLLVLCLLLFLALQFAAAAQKSYWEDEAFTAASVQRPIPELLAHPEDIDAYKPPLYFLAASAWGAAFGYEELPLSALSILFSAIAFVLVLVCASRVGGSRSALISAVLFAFSPIMLSYAHSVRYYSLALLLVMCSVSSVLALERNFRVWLLGGYILASIAKFYTIYTLVPVTVACFAWLGIVWVRRRAWRHLVIWVVAHGVIALGCLVWFPILLQGAKTWTSTAPLLNQSIKTLAIEVMKRLGFLLISFTSGETLVPTQGWALISMCIALIALGAGVWALWRRRSALGALMGAVLVCSVSFGVLVNIAGVYPDNSPALLPHRILFVYPLLLFFMGIGLSTFRKPVSLIALLVLTVCQIVSARNYFTGQQFLQPLQAVPWKSIMQTIQRDANSTTTIVCSTGDSACNFFVRRFRLPESNPQAALAAPLQSADIWWIQTNVGTDQLYDRSTEATQLDALKLRFQIVDSTNYVLHDPAIRALKRQLSGRTDYEYRVTVLHLRGPKK